MTLMSLLVVVAFVFALVEVVRTQAKSLLAWAVALIAFALTWPLLNT